VVGKAEDYAVDDEPDIAADDVMGQLRKALRSPSLFGLVYFCELILFVRICL